MVWHVIGSLCVNVIHNTRKKVGAKDIQETKRQPP